MNESLNQEVYNCDSSPFNAQVFDNMFCSIILEDGSGDQTLGKGRPVIGRKSIGKLSVLSIALKNKRKWKSQHE